jgi:CheY-like chemotaxis protein
VVYVRVSQQDVADGEAFPLDESQQTVDLVTRVDEDAFPSPRTGDNESVLLEGPGGLRLDYDHAVILAILDDLMFTSKIRTAAGKLGVNVAITRSTDGAIERMVSNRPSLVIFDLNNPRIDALGTVAAMKATPSLAAIRTMGFVSHVDTGTTNAARAAGINDVLPKSLFTTTLPQILSQYK